MGINKNYKGIYASELELKKESISISKASFWDVSVIIENERFKTKLYKRDTLYAPFSQ